ESEFITGYAVSYSEEGILIVENTFSREQEETKNAVWVSNLNEKHLGSLLRVELKDTADSYPSLSSSKKLRCWSNRMEREKFYVLAWNIPWKHGVMISILV